MKKKIIAVAAAAVCLFALASCGDNEKVSSEGTTTTAGTTSASTTTVKPSTTPKVTTTIKPTTTKITTTKVTTPEPDEGILLDVIPEGEGTTFESGSGIMAASMVLKYYGVDVDIMKLYNCMDMVSEHRQDITPWEYCMGTPKNMEALYYAPVVKNMINTYLQNNSITDIKAKDITGCEPEKIYNYVLEGTPVIVVANRYLLPEAEDGISWTLPNGETFTWKTETCFFVMIGINNDDVTVIDGELGQSYTISKSMIEESFKAYESQAILIE